MKIKLINPRAKKLTLKNSSRFQAPPWGLCAIAAVTPNEFEIVIEDEMVENINFDEEVDLVGITAITASVNRGYEIADEYRKRQIPVVMGGIHVSAMVDEALEHADAVVIGEAEVIWSTVLEDLNKGKMKGKYQADRYHNMVDLPSPRLDLLKNKKKYFPFQYVETTRGCPFNCEFCSATNFYGKTQRKRPVDEVIKDVQKLNRKRPIFFVDDNIGANPKHCRELFEKLTPLKIWWGGQTGVKFLNNEELLSLSTDSGSKYFFVGFESPNENSLKEASKKHNNPDIYMQAIKKAHKKGAIILGAFMIGFDNDGPDIFQKIDNFIKISKVDAIQLNIIYPYPGTRLRERLLNENRLTSDDWDNYLFDGINFIPKNMTQEELHQGYLWLLKNNSSLNIILRRCLRRLFFGNPLLAIPVLLLNLGTRRHYKHMLRNIKESNPIRKGQFDNNLKLAN